MSMESKVLLDLRGIKKSFESEEGKLAVLNGVNLRLNKNEIIAIVGESGTGKSTLLHVASGLLSPEEGEIYWKEERIDRLPSWEKDKRRRGFMGFVFQMPMLMEELTVLENIIVSMMISGKSFEKSPTQKALNLLKMVNMQGKENHRPSTLSVGEAQRTAVLRAVAFSPEVVLADEPTASLDPANTLKMAHLIKDLRDRLGTAFLIVTHNLEFAEKVADRIMLLEDGTLKEAILTKT